MRLLVRNRRPRVLVEANCGIELRLGPAFVFAGMIRKRRTGADKIVRKRKS
jgi:hypothetical protein